MMPRPLSASRVKERITTVELTLSRLAESLAQATYRQSALVGECIESAESELEAAIRNLFRNELEKAFDLAGIAWLHADFGRQILEAEAIEHLLGESDYIELADISIPWRPQASLLLDSLDEQLKQLCAEIAAEVQ